MNERCDKHSITRCPICASLSGKKTQTLSVAPPEITGAPPADIEQMDSNALRAEIAASPVRFPTQEEVDESQQKLNALRGDSNYNFARQVPGFTLEPKQPGPAPDRMAKETFDNLPVDDSHASKVVRAAAAYATASKDWAQNLARVEKIKSELLKAEALLHEALVAKETSECDLKTLVTG